MPLRRRTMDPVYARRPLTPGWIFPFAPSRLRVQWIGFYTPPTRPVHPPRHHPSHACEQVAAGSRPIFYLTRRREEREGFTVHACPFAVEPWTRFMPAGHSPLGGSSPSRLRAFACNGSVFTHHPLGPCILRGTIRATRVSMWQLDA